MLDVALAPLGPDDATALAHALAPELAPELADEVLAEAVDRAEGVPFFVEEMVAAAREGSAGTSLPQGVRDVVEGRLAELPDDDRAVLAAAAVLGRDVDVRLLAAMTGRPLPALLDPLDRAVGRRLLVEDPAAAGRLSFGHALVRDALLAGLTACAERSCTAPRRRPSPACRRRPRAARSWHTT